MLPSLPLRSTSAALLLLAGLPLTLASCLSSYEAPGADSGAEGEGEGEREAACTPGDDRTCNTPPWDAPWVSKLLGACAADESCSCGEGARLDVSSARCAPDEGVDMGVGQPAYRWIRVCSLAAAAGDPASPGPDIDAIGVRSRATQEVFWATQVAAFAPASDERNAFTDPQRALGEGDTTSLSPAHAACEPDADCAGVVSLGGTGGYLILGFDRDLLPGDRVAVLEAGPGLDPTEAPDAASVALSYQPGPDGYWIDAGPWDGTSVVVAPAFVPKLPGASCP